MHEITLDEILQSQTNYYAIDIKTTIIRSLKLNVARKLEKTMNITPKNV